TVFRWPWRQGKLLQNDDSQVLCRVRVVGFAKFLTSHLQECSFWHDGTTVFPCNSFQASKSAKACFAYATPQLSGVGFTRCNSLDRAWGAPDLETTHSVAAARSS